MVVYLSVKSCVPIYFLSFYLIRQPHRLGREQITDVTDVEKEGGERYHSVSAGG